MGLPTALVGQVRHQINYQDVVEATKLKIQKQKPLTVKKGAKGYIGTAEGIADSKVTLTFAQPADKAQFEAFAMEAQEGILGFDYVFYKGSSIFLIPNCFCGNADMDNDPGTGNIDVTLEIQGATMVQIQ